MKPFLRYCLLLSLLGVFPWLEANSSETKTLLPQLEARPKNEKYFPQQGVQKKINATLLKIGVALYDVDELVKSPRYISAKSRAEKNALVLHELHKTKWELFRNKQKKPHLLKYLPFFVLGVIIIVDIVLIFTEKISELRKGNLLLFALRLFVPSLQEDFSSPVGNYLWNLYWDLHTLGYINFLISMPLFGFGLSEFAERLLRGLGLRPPDTAEFSELINNLFADALSTRSLQSLIFYLLKIFIMLFGIPTYYVYRYTVWYQEEFWLDIAFPEEVAKRRITLYDELDDLEDDYLITFKYGADPVPEGLQDAIEESFIDYRQGDQSLREVEERIILAKKFLAAMALAQQKPTSRNAMHKKLDQALAYVPDEVNSQMKSLLEKTQQEGDPLLLLGDTGIGKTTFIMALGESLGGKTLRLNLEELHTIEDIKGTWKYPGALITGMVKIYEETKQPVTVIFIDQVEDLLEKNNDVIDTTIELAEELKDNTVDLPYFQLQLKLSTCNAFASNEDLKETNLEPLLDLTQQVHFQGLSPDKKKQFVNREVLPRLEKELGVDLKHLSEEEQQELEEILDKDKTTSFAPIQDKLLDFALEVKEKRQKG